jgi:hypothetical protein
MRVLWFANTPCGAFSDEIKGTGGWLDSLAAELSNSKDVELFIAFHYPYKRRPFKKGNIWYYPIKTGNPIWEIIKKRVVVEINDQRFLSKYLDVINQINPDIINIQDYRSYKAPSDNNNSGSDYSYFKKILIRFPKGIFKENNQKIHNEFHPFRK